LSALGAPVRDLSRIFKQFLHRLVDFPTFVDVVYNVRAPKLDSLLKKSL
jgi:hypothetical protein